MLAAFKDKPVNAIKPELVEPLHDVSRDCDGLKRDCDELSRDCDELTPVPNVGKTGSSITPAKSYAHWKNTLIKSLSGYHGDMKFSDVLVFVGDIQLPAHTLVLDINSSLLTAAKESTFFPGKIEVNLLKWSDITGVVVDIIKSFYTGDIFISSDNIKAVYKFSKCFNITWLVEHCLRMFEKEVSSNNVLDIIRLSTTVKCDRLKELCLRLLNPTFISDLTAGKYWEMCDVNTVKIVLSSPHSNISEIQRFELACKWFEAKPKPRADNIKSLLTCINFSIIRETDLLGKVYDWFSVYPDLDDKTRLELLVSMNKYIRVPGILRLQTTSSFQPEDDAVLTESRPPSHVIKDIVASVTQKKSERCTTPSELLAVLKHDFIRSDKETCFSIIQYISDNRLIDRENITELCKLYHVTGTQGIINLILHYFSDHMISRVHDVRWEELPGDALRRIVCRLDAGQNEYLLLEVIMRWVAQHHLETENITELLAMVCYDFIPAVYKNDIFLPFIRSYIPDATSFSCSLHTTHKSHLKKGTAMVRAVPKDFYFIKNFEHRVKGYTIRLDKGDEASPLKLCYTKPGGKSRGGSQAAIVLYDKKERLSSYPCAGHVTLRQLKRIVNDYSDLHFMLLNV